MSDEMKAVINELLGEMVEVKRDEDGQMMFRIRPEFEVDNVEVKDGE